MFIQPNPLPIYNIISYSYIYTYRYIYIYIYIYIQSTLGKSDYGYVGLLDKSDIFSWFG